MRLFCAAAVVLLSGANVWAFGHGGSGVEQGLAAIGPKGEVQLTLFRSIAEQRDEQQTVDVWVERKVTYDTVVAGKTVQRERVEKVPETRIQTHRVTVWKLVPETKVSDPQLTHYYETDGRAVDPKTLSRRLAKPALVVLQWDGKPLADYYAWMFKPGTLIVSMTPAPDAVPVPAPVQPLPPPGPPKAEGPKSTENDSAARAVRVPVIPVIQSKADAGEAKGPQGPSPQFQLASVDPKGMLNLRRLNEFANETTAYKEIKDARGIVRKAPFSMTVLNRTSNILQVDPQHVQFSTADGKAVDSQRLPQILPREQSAIVSTDGKPVDPFWLQNIKPSVLVALVPGGAMFGGMYGGHGAIAMPVVSPPPAAPAAPPLP